MSEKEKLIENLVSKTGKSLDDINKLVSDKVNELSGLVSEEGAIYIVANDIGVKLDAERPKKEADTAKIEDITEAKVPTSLVCKVIRKYDKVTFQSKSGSEGSVQSVLVGDETGVIRIVFWNEKTEVLDNIQDGDILSIINAYTRENTNSERIEIHFGQYSDIEVNSEGVTIELPAYTPKDIEFTEKKITEMAEGDKNVKITGIVTDYDIPRFYLGCPECFKKVQQDDGKQMCAQHGEVTAQKIPIVNMIIDDSTGTIAVVGFRDRAEQLSGVSTEEVLGFTEDIDKYRSFCKRIIGAKVELGGNVTTNNMTGDIQIMANQVSLLELKSIEEITKDEVTEEAKKAEATDDEDLDIEEIDFDDDML
jgi:ssDNA-binding replication factor A large subunit